MTNRQTFVWPGSVEAYICRTVHDAVGKSVHPFSLRGFPIRVYATHSGTHNVAGDRSSLRSRQNRRNLACQTVGTGLVPVRQEPDHNATRTEGSAPIQIVEETGTNRVC